MELAKAFDLGWVQVSRPGRGEQADEYDLVRREKDVFHLKARAGILEAGLPEENEAVLLRAVKSEALYQVAAIVLEREDATPARLVVRGEAEAERIQRRRCFRVPVKVGLEVTQPDVVPPRPFRATMADLSAGGVRLVFDHAVFVGQSFLISLDLEDGLPPLRCKGQAVRVMPLADNQSNVGITFQNITEAQEGRITDYLLVALLRRLGGKSLKP